MEGVENTPTFGVSERRDDAMSPELPIDDGRRTKM